MFVGQTGHRSMFHILFALFFCLSGHGVVWYLTFLFLYLDIWLACFFCFFVLSCFVALLTYTY